MTHHHPETVAEVMNRSFWTLAPESSLDEAEAVLALSAARHWPVTRGRKLLGTVSIGDLMGAFRWLPRTEEERFFDHRSLTTGGVMDRAPVTVGPHDDIASVGQRMLHDRLSLLPIVEGSSLVGIVTLTDFVRLAIRVLRDDGDSAGCAVPVTAVMSSGNLVVARPRDSLSEVELRMRRGRVRHVPVVDRDRVVGILSDRDVLGAMRTTTPQWAMKVSSVMTPAPITTAASADAVTAAFLMLRRAVGALPVVDDESLVGMLTKTDYLGYVVTRLSSGRLSSVPPPAPVTT